MSDLTSSSSSPKQSPTSMPGTRQAAIRAAGASPSPVPTCSSSGRRTKRRTFPVGTTSAPGTSPPSAISTWAPLAESRAGRRSSRRSARCPRPRRSAGCARCTTCYPSPITRSPGERPRSSPGTAIISTAVVAEIPPSALPGSAAAVARRCDLTAYPRVSPAIIVLIERDDRILLARGRAFVPRRFGIIAGFVEPGESLEDAVRREVREEVGIELDRHRLLR